MASHDDSVLREELTQWFLAVLDPSHPEGIAVYRFVDRTLIQLKLRESYDPAYILHEVYLRAIDYIWKENKRILNPIPWIKATAFSIIRELACKGHN